MRKSVPAIALVAALSLFVAGCGCMRSEEPAPANEPQVTGTVEQLDAGDAATSAGDGADELSVEEVSGKAGATIEGKDEADELLPEAEPTTDALGAGAEVAAEAAEDAVAETVPAETGTGSGVTGFSTGNDTLDELVGWGISTWGTLSDAASEQLEARRTAEPVHAALGDEVAATENLAVSVVAVEAGPYDYLDQSPTVMVTVRMRNTSDHVVTVKASNWDADNTSGLRVDHKYAVVNEESQVVAQSFTTLRISPGATVEAVVYFDGEGLVSVIYEPHWLVSAENEYIYFDL